MGKWTRQMFPHVMDSPHTTGWFLFVVLGSFLSIFEISNLNMSILNRMVLDFSILLLFLRNINFATTRLYEWNSSRRCTEVFETLKKSSYNYIHYINVTSLTVTYMKITSYFVLQQYNGYVGKLLFFFRWLTFPNWRQDMRVVCEVSLQCKDRDSGQYGGS